MKKIIIPMIFVVLLVTTASALEIKSPENNETYNESTIPLIVESNETYNEIIYYLNEDEPTRCFNCTGFNETLNVTEGNHTLHVSGIKGNETTNTTVKFHVNLTLIEEHENFTLTINQPENTTYNTSNIPVNVTANTTLDNITITIENHTETCLNCPELLSNLSLANGTYTLKATGKLGNTTLNTSTVFSIQPEEPTPPPEETTPRFTLGLQHLPRAVEIGELSDSELAGIIRENELNPGILNRLIKTGALGGESIDAILETQQKRPPGIFNRFLRFIGVQTSTAELIHENYNLTENNLQNLVTREDLPSSIAEQVKEQLQERTAQRAPPVTPPGQAKQETTANGEEQDPQEERRGPPVVIGAQNGDDEEWMPPGLAKKDKVPPGHARR